MINLDNASTTKPFNEVVNAVAIALSEDYLNMGAKYKQAKIIEQKMTVIKHGMLKLMRASEGDFVFTPSATVANNLVFASINPKGNKKILVSAGEHSSVFECAKHLSELGVKVEFIPLCEFGNIDIAKFKEMMTPDVSFVSVMHVSNETGAINDIKEIAAYAKQVNPNCLVHSDGVQAFGKIDVNIDDLGLDFYTISAHKINGPKGIGALYAKNISKLKTLIYGGGQENNLISGTENYAYMSGFYTAAKLKLASFQMDFDKVSGDKEGFVNALKDANIKFEINGSLSNASPYILNLSIKGIRGEVLLHALAEIGILIATGSACSSKKRGNRVLENMGKNATQIDSSVRISFSAMEDYKMEAIAENIKEIVDALVK